MDRTSDGGDLRCWNCGATNSSALIYCQACRHNLHMQPRPDIAPATSNIAVRARRPVITVTLIFTLVLAAAASVTTLRAVAALTPHVPGWNGQAYGVWALSPYVALAVLACAVRRGRAASAVVLVGTLITAGPATLFMRSIIGAPSADAQLGLGLGFVPYVQWLVVVMTSLIAVVLIARPGVEE